MKTKKDFEFTAALLNAALKGTPPLNLVQLASAKFAKDNPRFDEERFKEACGYYDECERLIKKWKNRLTFSNIDAILYYVW